MIQFIAERRRLMICFYYCIQRYSNQSIKSRQLFLENKSTFPPSSLNQSNFNLIPEHLFQALHCLCPQLNIKIFLYSLPAQDTWQQLLASFCDPLGTDDTLRKSAHIHATKALLGSGKYLQRRSIFPGRGRRVCGSQQKQWQR